ncbi:hypothetical protein BN946_scf184803.g15 [Trametes cinnabarina]|uniref:Protein kinase domain-containing protein n=1 Tax=Pycnoporus cinnabarinus TaxID=5643 RepID=A0A060S5V8_PYCCI|nr:hypothetical protein BN946_scf184803.g15 [Trametes cinnabarina]
MMAREEPCSVPPPKGEGYFPLRVGTRLADGRYTLVRKLGWGAGASVWLARTWRSEGGHRYVAIKVLTAMLTEDVLRGSSLEVRMFEKLSDGEHAKDEHPGRRHCLTAESVFTEDSVHGRHICIVTPPFGQNVAELRISRSLDEFPLSALKSVVKQTLLALDYLHRILRVVHMDVKASNIFVQLRASDEDITHYLQRHPAEEKRPQETHGEQSFMHTRSQPLPNFGLDPSLKNLHVCLGDYGGTVPIPVTSEMPGEMATTPFFVRAPELYLGHHWSTPVDIWAVGCMISELLVPASPLFPQDLTRIPDDQQRRAHFARITERLGQFPLDFLHRCPNRDQYFDAAGEPPDTERTEHDADPGRPILALPPQGGTLEAFLGNDLHVRRCFSQEDLQAIFRFMRRCLEIDPEKRPTAEELLRDEWLRL